MKASVDVCGGCGFAFVTGACLYTEGRWHTVCPTCGKVEPRGTSPRPGVRFERRPERRLEERRNA